MPHKRVLLIANEFPPLWGGGVPRPFAFARYLAQQGWDVTVLTLQPEYYDMSLGQDLDKLALLPASVTIVRTKALRPKANVVSSEKKPANNAPVITKQSFFARFKSSLRGLFIIPDKEITWYLPAVKAGKKILKQADFDIIWSSSPQISTHIIGAKLQKKFNLPWVADFRDPVPLVENSSKPRDLIRNYFLKKTLKSVFKRASHIVSVATRIQEQLQKYAGTFDKFTVIENGYDPADFEDLPTVTLKPDVINMTYVGSLFGKRATPEILAGLTQALEQLNKSKPRVHLHLVGPIAPVFQARFQARSDVTLHGPQNHKRALAFMKQGDLNILLATTQVQDSYPGKLFEYLAAGKPIILLVKPKSLLSEFCKKYQLGAEANPKNTNEISKALVKAVLDWDAGVRELAHADLKERFNRQKQTVRLIGIFDSLMKNDA
ncbi:glycosyltransferase [Patescibacteria group bacterium]